MDDDILRGLEATTAGARALQERLRARVVRRGPAGFRPRTVAGLDVSANRRSRVGFAGIVVLDADSLETVEEVALSAELRFPYVPGLLSFRELPLLAAAWARLRTRPDLLVFDGQGLAHPRRFGLACHGGLLFDRPAIGCAKSLLVGEHAALGTPRGAVAPIEHAGETVGAALRTRTGVRPVFVSPGHRIDLSHAVEWVLRLTPRWRLPETTRRSHRLVNELRRTMGSGTSM